MSRFRRSERVAVILRTLLDRPNNLVPLSSFARRFGLSRPTISDDISMLKSAFALGLPGDIETVSGAGGGVRLVPGLSPRAMSQLLSELATTLSEPSRLLAGGFLYMTDIIFSPLWASQIGELFAGLFLSVSPDCVVTVETKGIPLALMTARWLGCPLVVVRRNTRVSEGPSVSINYMSGSADRIQTMSLPRRAVTGVKRCLVIDDFMRAGGTARGICDLLREVGAQAVAVGALIETREPEAKLVSGYTSLLRLSRTEQSGDVAIEPGPFVY